ncbi:MAG: mitofilin family membrane protein [Methyloceanibacter sp.]|uniref:COG4223 family protein n=1 Tax=Methyloceanibacter sp. TaxID=1965321 RepID=UPI003EE38F1D
MGGSFDNKGSGDPAGKRPTPTIEGTATEVSVEPEAQEAKKDANENEGPNESETKDEAAENANALPPHDGDEAEKTGEGEQPAAETTERHGSGRSFAAVLLAAVTSFLTHAAAGLIGGLAVLAAIAAWGYLPLSAPTDAPDLAPLEGRIAKLEASPQTPDNSEKIEKLETRLADLEATASETPPETTALDDRVAQLETSLKSMAEAAKEGGSVADAAAISQQINDAEKRLDEKIETALAEAKSGAETDTTAIDSLKKDLADVDAKLKALTEAELGSEEAAQLLPEIAVLDERLRKIESTLPQLLEAVDEDINDTKRATLAIAFANLRAAVDDGRPYAGELAALAQLSPGAGDFGSLLDYEDTGIPTVRALTASFEEAREDALSTQESTGDASIIDRLLGSAESLVKIRRIDEAAEGDQPDAVLARAGGKLEQGDLGAAVKEVETLQGAPREAFAKWLDAAHARLDAEVTLRRLQNVLLVSLGGSGAVEKTEEQE